MNSKLTDEELADRKTARRLDRDAEAFERMWARREKAEQMIGELMHEGQRKYYVYPVGGKYREGSKDDLIDYLIRNRYA